MATANEAAFPEPARTGAGTDVCTGLTKLEYFAARILAQMPGLGINNEQVGALRALRYARALCVLLDASKQAKE